MDLNYDKVFQITLQAMRINRSDPVVKRDIKWMLWFLLVHGVYTMVYVLVVYNIIFVNLKQNDFSGTCKNGILSVVYNVITFQYFIMVWKQEHLKILMDTIKKDFDLAKLLPAHEQKIIYEYAMKGNHVCKQWLALSIAGPGLFPVKNVALIIFHWIVEGELHLIPIYDLVYPEFMGKNKETLAGYSFMYILIIGYGTYSSFTYCAFVPLGPIFMLHACGQLEVIKRRIDVVFNSDDLEEIEQKLKDIVRQLQRIYEFIDRINLIFKVAYEFTMKVTTLLLPITSYEVLESLKHGDVSLEFLVFIVGGVLFSSTPCFYSDLLMEKGEDIRVAMYSCGWEKVYSRNIRSTVCVVLQRALRPTAIRTLFRTVCLDALTDLFQQSFTIFNLMNAMWN